MISPGAVASFVTSSLQVAPQGVPALTLISSAVLIPVTQIRNLYAISLGYGGSVAAMGWMIHKYVSTLSSSSLSMALSSAAIFYGVRLFVYLAVREAAFPDLYESQKSRKQPSRLRRISFSLSLAAFYACMMTPTLAAIQALNGKSTTIAAGLLKGRNLETWVRPGVVLAWIGAVMEAIADLQKFIVKKRSKGSAFRGPSSGMYAVTRHPNYTGEVLFWIGTFLAGAPALTAEWSRSIVSIVGLYGIVSIMRGATKRLEKKQTEKYGGQSPYDDWKKRVKSPLWPFLSVV